jgi:hypothetical protein
MSIGRAKSPFPRLDREIPLTVLIAPSRLAPDGVFLNQKLPRNEEVFNLFRC